MELIGFFHSCYESIENIDHMECVGCALCWILSNMLQSLNTRNIEYSTGVFGIGEVILISLRIAKSDGYRYYGLRLLYESLHAIFGLGEILIEGNVLMLIYDILRDAETRDDLYYSIVPLAKQVISQLRLSSASSS
jgi:hypothetical protein